MEGEPLLVTLKGVDEWLRAPSSDSPRARARQWSCAREAFLACGQRLRDAGARLLTLSALCASDDELLLTYTFEVEGRGSVTLRTTTERRSAESLFSVFPAADFLEREVSSLFGVKFVGHPNLAPTVAGEV